jgi:probable rRNA maturation factor
LGWSEAELSLTLLNDRAMARLNRETFGRRGPTNVISFPMDAELAGGGERTTPAQGEPPPVLGEVVISLETTCRQARETDWPWQELLDFFLIHGILHLLGYDHELPEDAARMDDKTWELLRLLHPGIEGSLS